MNTRKETNMATAKDVAEIVTPNKITKEERAVLTNGLDMLYTSLMRSAKSAKSTALRDAFELEAQRVMNLTSKLNSGELQL